MNGFSFQASVGSWYGINFHRSPAQWSLTLGWVVLRIVFFDWERALATFNESISATQAELALEQNRVAVAVGYFQHLRAHNLWGVEELCDRALNQLKNPNNPHEQRMNDPERTH